MVTERPNSGTPKSKVGHVADDAERYDEVTDERDLPSLGTPIVRSRQSSLAPS